MPRAHARGLRPLAHARGLRPLATLRARTRPLRWARPAPSALPALPPSPPPHARGGSRFAPSGRCCFGGLLPSRRLRSIDVYRLCLSWASARFVSLLRGCPVAVGGLQHHRPFHPRTLSPASRGWACRPPAPSFGRACAPYGQSGLGATPPVFFGCRHSSRPPVGRVSRSRYPRSRFPRPLGRSYARIPHSEFMRASRAILGGENAPSPARRPLNNRK